MSPAGWKAVVCGQESDKWLRCLQEMSIQGVDEGPKLFSMESDGWEEPCRGMSTRPALLPARQGTSEPARSSSGCGDRLGVETHGLRELKRDQKSKHTYLHLRMRSLMFVHRLGPCAWGSWDQSASAM